MTFRMPGRTALAAILIAMAAPAPLAFAQNGQAQVQVSREIAQPLNEARTAIVAKDFVTGKAKLDAASAKAKTPVDKAQIERLRLYMASEQKDGRAQITSINALIASGQLTPDEVKQYKGALAKAYLDAGDQPGSLNAYRAYIDEYGGTPDQLISIANDYSKANDNATAVTYATKAIDASIAAGNTPPEPWFKLLARSYHQQDMKADYYRVLERTLAAYPNNNYWKELIVRVQEEPNYGAVAKLDMFRALQAAGVPLTPSEKAMVSEEAIKRGLPAEALSVLEPAVASGELASQRDKDNLASAKSQSASDKAGLAKETADVLAKGTGSDIASIGEAHLSYGDNAKAAEVLQAAIAKGIADPGELAMAKVHLGIAQYRAGQKDAAVATWSDAKADNGATVLAQNWILISKLKS